MRTIFIFCIWLAPLCSAGQTADTTVITRQVDSLLRITDALANKPELEKALEVCAIAEKIALEQIGEWSAVYGNCCHSRGRILFFKKDYPEAEKWYLKALSIREKVLGKEHRNYAATLNNLGNVYLGTRNYKKALPCHLDAKAIRENLLGKEDPDYIWSVNSLAYTYWQTGEYEKAEALFNDALPVLEKIRGKEHPDYRWTLGSVGGLYFDLGNYEKAESIQLENQAICAKVLGAESMPYAYILGNLASLYYRMSQYEKAEPIVHQSQAIIKKVLGTDHPDFAKSLIIEANLYLMMGNNQKAESKYLEAIAIWEKNGDMEHPDFVKNLANLAILYLEMGNYQKAAPLFLNVQEIVEKQQEKSLLYVTNLMGLASLYAENGDYGKAAPLFLQGKTASEIILGQSHPEHIDNLLAVAKFNFATGNHEKAQNLYLEAKTTIEKTIGKRHHYYTRGLKGLTMLYETQQQFLASEPLLAEISTLEQTRLSKSASFLSERELSNYTALFQVDGDRQLSYLYTRKAKSMETKVLSLLCYDHILFQKGFLLYTSNCLKTLSAASPIGKDLQNQLKSDRRRLANEYSKPFSERDSTRVAQLEERMNRLEKELTRTVAGYGDAMRQVKWQEVQAALKPGEAALEFVHYRYYNPKTTDSTMYAALLLRPGDTQPQFIPLFEEKELLPLLRGATGGSNFLKINALYAPKTADNKQKSLYELIWKPLENLLNAPSAEGGRGEAKTIYCAPSGLLHRLNLAAIPNASGKTFGDQYGLVLLGSTRQLVVPNAPTSTSNSAYLAGGIRYDADSTAVVLANRGTSSRSVELPQTLPFQPDSASTTRGGTLDYLPATAAEVREIGQTLAAAGIRAKVDTGFYATEEVFRQLGVGAPSPRIVHLATHGYFFPDPVKKDQKAFGGFGQEPVFKMSEHPMIRSGLILAGAKQAWLTGQHPTGLEDGILTAYEISQMNLTGTELVVLSACETGLGDIVGNEGVYGLQRAFKIAGAKYLVMSLWKVDDRSTRAFMTAFYRHWLTDKQPVPQAFRAAQRELRAKRPGAYDWAGFVLVE